jgi:hypothetical protein
MFKKGVNMQKREENKPPAALEKWGWKYHHLGVPTTQKMPNEIYLAHLKFAVSGFQESPFGIEWMRFDEDCPLPEIIQTVPHLAFQVDNLEKAIHQARCKLIAEPIKPASGVRTAMIEHNGAPIELIEFTQ